MMKFNKLYFFWIAEYGNEKILPQFDFKTGEENLFKDVDLNKTVKFGWYPFTIELSKKVSNSVVNPFLPHYIINIKKDEKLFVRRRGYITTTGRIEKRKYEYLLGIYGKYMLIIDESGNVNVKNCKSKSQT